mmetsp:Transcript_193/g.334  ORF Transcript_193/g.334 Transcript_193/m.334 type:complete len:224 (+) Transcript_193:277-948(+)
MLHNHVGERHQALFDGHDVSLGSTTEGFQEFISLDAGDHAMGFVTKNGSKAELDILKDFDENTTDTKHDKRSKYGVTIGTKNDFLTLGSHLLNQNSFDGCLGIVCKSILNNCRICLANFVRRLEFDNNTTRIRFMQNLRRVNLHDNRISHFLGKSHRFRITLGQLGRHGIETIAFEQLIPLQFSHSRATFVQTGLDNRFGFLGVMFERELCQVLTVEPARVPV